MAVGSKLDEAVDKYVDVYVYHPCKCFWTCCALQFLLTAASIGLQCMVPERKDGAWLVFQNPNTQYWKSWETLEEKLEEEGIYRRLSATVGGRKGRRLEEETRMQLFYKTNVGGSGNIFTSENLAAMCMLERVAVRSTYGGTWARVDGPVMGFYGEDHTKWNCSLLPQSYIDAQMLQVRQEIAVQGAEAQSAAYVHPSMNVTGVSAYTRSVITKRMHEDDESEWQEDILNEVGLSYGWMRSAYQGDEDRFVQYKSIRVRLFPDDLDEMFMLSYDFLMAFGAVIVVYGVMYVYLRSFWLASWGMYQIIFSLPIGALFYKMVFQIKYFEFLHILIVYLVLGIGADDIFVLIDSFKHIAEEFPVAEGAAYTPADLHKVLKKTLLRVSQAIFNTSLTTSVAFLSSAVSKVMPMRTCGLYAAICIITVFILTITFSPAVLAIYHYRYQGKRCCCPAPSSRVAGQLLRKESESNDSDNKEPHMGPVERFMFNCYVPVMSKKVGGVRIFALLGVLLMLGVAAQGIIFTVQLTPPTKVEIWVPENHMTVELNEFMSANYMSPDYKEFAIITVFWGVDKLDIDKMDPYNPQDFNDGLVYDPAFDPSTQAAQDHIKYVCQQMREVTCRLEGCRNHPYGTLMMKSSERTHACFIEDFETWIQQEGQQHGFSAGATGQAFRDQLYHFQDYGNWGESTMLYPDYYRRIAFLQGELRMVAVAIRSTLPEQEPYKTGIDVRSLMDDYVEQWKAQAPDSMTSIKYVAEGAFATYDLGEELIKGLFQGCAISLPIAFLVLLFSTKNIFASLYAVLSVVCIVTSVLGFCKSAMDWDLGIGEAIAGVIVIGYSVDYVLHLAHIYCEAGHYGFDDRDARCKFAIRNLGTTVFAGAITTAGSGAIMFYTFFTFFFKMAVLITITIMYSFLYAFILFMGLMWLIGPVGACGDIRCWNWRAKKEAAADIEPTKIGEKC